MITPVRDILLISRFAFNGNTSEGPIICLAFSLPKAIASQTATLLLLVSEESLYTCSIFNRTLLATKTPNAKRKTHDDQGEANPILRFLKKIIVSLFTFITFTIFKDKVHNACRKTIPTRAQYLRC